MASTQIPHILHLRPGRRARTLVLAALCVLVVAAGAAPAAHASGNRTGVYTGTAVHDPFSFAPDAIPYKTKFVVRVNQRRVTGLYVEARLECPEVSIIDVRYARLVMKRKPALSPTDGFSLRRNGIVVRGHIGRRRAEGTIHAVKGDCESPDIAWKARKTL